MPECGRHAAAFFLLGAVAGSVTAQEASSIRVSGYYKNLLSHSRTLVAEAQSYHADLNRLRVQLQGQVTPALGFEFQYDNELLLGSYLRTRQFDLQKELRANQFWHLESNYAESSHAYGRHRLYRGFFTLSAADTDIRIGRQRVAWGTGRFWSPLDVLNPISPVQLEREERPGVDAILLERKLGELSRVSIAYAPQHARADSSAALYWHGNAAGIDVSLVSGRFAGDKMLGADIATQLGQAGLRGEFSYTMPRTGRHYRRALAALDYAFANTLTLSAEFYYNGAGAGSREQQRL